MSYYGDGKRRCYEDSDGACNFLWDGENIALLTDEDDLTARTFTRRPAGFGELVSQRYGGSTSFHHGVYPERTRGDALGSSDRLSDGSQAELIHYQDRAFGEQSVLSGSSTNRQTWVGKVGYYRQPDLGNYWLGARIYDAINGRFQSRDPAAAEVNRARSAADGGQPPEALIAGPPASRLPAW